MTRSASVAMTASTELGTSRPAGPRRRAGRPLPRRLPPLHGGDAHHRAHRLGDPTRTRRAPHPPKRHCHSRLHPPRRCGRKGTGLRAGVVAQPSRGPQMAADERTGPRSRVQLRQPRSRNHRSPLGGHDPRQRRRYLVGAALEHRHRQKRRLQPTPPASESSETASPSPGTTPSSHRHARPVARLELSAPGGTAARPTWPAAGSSSSVRAASASTLPSGSPRPASGP